MSTTPDTSAFVNAIACDLEQGGFRQVSGTTLRRTLATAVSAALPLLEAGNPVPGLAEQHGGAPDTYWLPDLPRPFAWDPQIGAPLYDGEQMHQFARAALAATGKQQVGEARYHPAQRQADIEGRIEPSARELEGLHDQQVGEVQGDVLAALVAKWRAQAATHEVNGLEADSIGLTTAAMRNDARAHVLEEAANELQAALAASKPSQSWSRKIHRQIASSRLDAC